MKTSTVPGFNLGDVDVAALVAEVKDQVQAIIKNETEAGRLQKSDPPAPPDASGSASASGSPSASPEGSASGSPSAGPEGSMGGPPAGDPGAPPADPSAPPAGDPGLGDPSAGAAPAAGPSFEELVTLYAQLPEPDFQAHIAAIQQSAQMRQAGGAPGAAPGMGAPGMGAPGAAPSPGGMPPSAGPGPSAPPMGAGPGPSAPPSAPPSPDQAFGKAEKRMADLEALVKSSQEQLKQVGQVLEQVLTLPQRKAVTGLTVVPFRKSEPAPAFGRKPFVELKKDKVALHAELVKMTANPELKKAERQLITGFYCGDVKVDALEQLFPDKQ